MYSSPACQKLSMGDLNSGNLHIEFMLGSGAAVVDLTILASNTFCIPYMRVNFNNRINYKIFKII